MGLRQIEARLAWCDVVVPEICPRAESVGSDDLRTPEEGRDLLMLGYGPMLRQYLRGNTGTVTR